MIETTDEHPFWREAGGNIAEGWMRADGLAPCDRVRTLSGSAVVESVRFLSERTTVYNLTVTSDPSYLIGDDGLWVHNCSNFRQIFIETFEATGRKFPENHHVHHRIPQKYRGLFPDEVDDISNWVGVPEKVHGRINGRWNTFRAKHKKPSNEEIRSFVAEIDLEFSQYYLTP